jgi:hypothetical protein
MTGEEAPLPDQVTEPPPREDVLLVSSSDDIDDVWTLAERVEALGGEIDVIIPPRTLLGRLDPRHVEVLRAEPLAARVIPRSEHAEAEPVEEADARLATETVARLWDPDYREDLARTRENHVPTDRPCTEELGEGGGAGAPFGAGPDDTSVWLYGRIAIGVILPEGPACEGGNCPIPPNPPVDLCCSWLPPGQEADTEVWTQDEVADVQATLSAAFAELAQLYPEADLTFVIRFESAPPAWNPLQGIVESAYDPVVWARQYRTDGKPLPDEVAKSVLPNLGYPPNNRDYAAAIRDETNADWGFVFYIFDRSCTCHAECQCEPFPGCTAPPQPPYQAGKCLTAFAATPYATSWHNSDDHTMLHETGHVFSAADEYPTSGSPTNLQGYLQIPNANRHGNQSENGYFGGLGERAHCLMAGASVINGPERLCPYTQHTWGWRDLDADGVVDIVDTPPRSTIGALIPPSTFLGEAEVVPPPRDTTTAGVSLNEVRRVECRIVSGSKALTWLAASASDGAFNEPTEDFTWTRPALPNGTYTAQSRAFDSAGNGQVVPFSIAVTVTGSGITNAPPIASFATSTPLYVGLNRNVTFDATFDASHPYGVSDLEDNAASLLVRWDFDGNGTWDTGWSTSKVVVSSYATSGSKSPKLEVKDTAGSTAQTSRSLYVWPFSVFSYSPEARFTADAFGRHLAQSGDYFPVFNFDASATTDVETPASLIQVRWDFDGDGAWDTPYSTEKSASAQLALPHVDLDLDLTVFLPYPQDPSGAIAVVGDYALVGIQSPPGIRVVHLTTGALGQMITTAGVPYEIVIHPSGTRALVSEGTAGVEWLNVSSPGYYVNYGSLYVSFTNARGMAIEPGPAPGGPIVYVADEGTVKILRWPYTFYPPSLTSTTPTPGAVAVVGRYSGGRLYVGNKDNGGVQIFGITNLSAPALLGTVTGTGDTWGLYEYTQNLVVTDRNGRVLMVNVSNPSMPVTLKEYELLDPLTGNPLAANRCSGEAGLACLQTGLSGGEVFALDLETPDLDYALLEDLNAPGNPSGLLLRNGVLVLPASPGAVYKTSWDLEPRHSLSWKVRMEAIDSEGFVGEHAVRVWANAYNAPPSAALAVTGVSGLAATLSAAGTSDPDFTEPWDAYLWATWDFEDDGIWDTGFETPLVQVHTYPAAGTYTARVRVRDRYSAVDEATVQVTVP